MSFIFMSWIDFLTSFVVVVVVVDAPLEYIMSSLCCLDISIISLQNCLYESSSVFTGCYYYATSILFRRHAVLVFGGVPFLYWVLHI